MTVTQAEKATPSPGLGGKPCLIHREKAHVFADGTRKACCAATYCEWTGEKGHTRHSDGMRGGTSYSADVLDSVIDAEPEVEVSEDDEQEITVPTFGVANREDEFAPEQTEQEPVEATDEDGEYDDE